MDTAQEFERLEQKFHQQEREVHARVDALMHGIQRRMCSTRELALLRRLRTLDAEEWRAVETIVETMTTPPPPDVH